VKLKTAVVASNIKLSLYSYTNH